ncbi:MAG: hypothetical protein ABI579_05495, partial [Candidatus Sumerlaeota bacterium]
KLYGPDQSELQTEKEILLGAKAYEYIRYSADGSRGTGYAAILFLDKPADADRFMSFYRQYSAQMPDQYAVIQKVNVIILLYSTSKTYLDDIHFNRVDLLKPK